jgi:hypothetical protein
MLQKDQLNQEVKTLVGGKLNDIDYVDTFRGNVEFAKTYGASPNQIFLTNNKEL